MIRVPDFRTFEGGILLAFVLGLILFVFAVAIRSGALLAWSY